MANNRLQIYCKKCFEMEVLAKYYPIEWYGMQAENYDEFTFKHEKSCWALAGSETDFLCGCDMFGFRTESDDDGFISDYKQRPYKLIKKI